MFALSALRISLLSALLLAGIFAIFFHSSLQTAWHTLLRDEIAHPAVPLERVKFARHVPATDEQITGVLDRVPTDSLELIVPDQWGGLRVEQGPFSAQLKRHYGKDFPSASRGDRVVFYVDVPSEQLAKVNEPRVFFHRVYGDWRLYADSTHVGSGTARDRYVTIAIGPSTREHLRLTWVVAVAFPETLSTLDALHGLSIRSAADANRARFYLPMQHQFPHIVASIAFLCLTAVSLLLASSSPSYTDLWAFASFSTGLFFTIWIETPFYWESYDFGPHGRSDEFIVVRAISHAYIAFSATALCLSFFRVRGWFLGLILGLTTAWLGYAVWDAWPYGSPLASYQLYAQIDATVVHILWSTQLITLAFGLYTLVDQMLAFRRQGLTALLKPMWRRLGEAVTFTLAMVLMLGVYANALPKQSTTSGPDLFLLYGLVPAMAMLMQFYWMMTASQRFREKMAPRLDYVDYLVHNVGEQAYDWTYTGVLARFDLKGFKKFTSIKTKSPAHAKAVDDFIMRMRTELEPVVAGERTVFRFKTNGDENIWTLFAKDDATAREQLVTVVKTWRERSAELLAGWKDAFRRDVGAALDADDERVLEYVDLHAMFCVLKDMKIDRVGDAKHPDYICDSFTMLSEAFKTSLHDRVAMYRDEYELCVANGLSDVTFEPESGRDSKTGFLTWRSGGIPAMNAANDDAA